MKTYFKILFLIILNLFIFTACNKNTDFLGNNLENSQKEDLQIGIIGNKEPIKRANVSKMLALANYTKNEILNLEYLAKFKDISENDWYNKYINAVFIKGDMNGVLEDSFMPNEYLTLNQTQYLISKYDKSNKIKIKIDKSNKDKPISYALWYDIYSKMMVDKNIKEETLTILATNKTNKKISENYAITDKGIYCFEGIDADRYLNTKIKVLVKDLDVIATKEVLETSPVLTRCYIENIKNNEVTIFVGGVKKTLNIKDGINISEENIGMFADLKINNNYIENVEYMNTEIIGEIKQISNKNININNNNYILDTDFKVYSNIEDEIQFKNLNSLYVGQNNVRFYAKGNENKVYCAIINNKPNFEKIRVLIKNGSQNLFNSIEISSSGGFKLYVQNMEKEFSNADVLKINKDNDFKIAENQSIKLELINNEIGFNIKNFNEKEIPMYFGKLEIMKKNNGYVLINEIEFEKYIESILASNSNGYNTYEMLKTLAVINRTMALNNIIENKFGEFGANIDSSSILYNKITPSNEIKNVIKETYGEIILHNKELISPNYFAFSSGATSNSGEIWASKKFKEFPAEDKKYLKAKNLFESDSIENLEDEINANIFFKSKDIRSIENDSPWFRWTTTIEKNLIENLNNNIQKIYKENKDFIKTFENGEYIFKPIKSIGKIKDINVIKRGESGNVMEIEIIGEISKVLIFSDTAIRKLFNIDFLVNNNGEKINNIKILPSSSFVFDKIYDANGYLESISLYGGGYGHSVGLSLYAADKLAKNNKNYKDILNIFYTDIEILSFLNK